MNGWGQNWKELTGPTIGPFTDFSKNGLTVRMRNISVTRGVELYGEAEKALVKQLQDRLNELGCSVGTADGVAGRKTREAALRCRPSDTLPAKFDVTTLQTFVDYYAAAA